MKKYQGRINTALEMLERRELLAGSTVRPEDLIADLHPRNGMVEDVRRRQYLIQHVADSSVDQDRVCLDAQLPQDRYQQQ